MADQDLAARIQQLEDIEAIKNLRARYVWCADNKDWDGWASVLTEDFYFDSDGGIQQGRDAIVASVSKAMAGASTAHHIYNPELTVTGDTAHAVWPMEDWVRITVKGKAMAFHGLGYYTDDYVRTPDGWRLSRCVMSRLRVDPLAVDAPSPATS